MEKFGFLGKMFSGTPFEYLVRSANEIHKS